MMTFHYLVIVTAIVVASAGVVVAGRALFRRREAIATGLVGTAHTYGRHVVIIGVGLGCLIIGQCAAQFSSTAESEVVKGGVSILGYLVGAVGLVFTIAGGAACFGWEYGSLYLMRYLRLLGRVGMVFLGYWC
jgi:hypothetical protein